MHPSLRETAALSTWFDMMKQKRGVKRAKHKPPGEKKKRSSAQTANSINSTAAVSFCNSFGRPLPSYLPSLLPFFLPFLLPRFHPTTHAPSSGYPFIVLSCTTHIFDAFTHHGERTSFFAPLRPYSKLDTPPPYMQQLLFLFSLPSSFFPFLFFPYLVQLLFCTPTTATATTTSSISTSTKKKKRYKGPLFRFWSSPASLINMCCRWLFFL